MIALQQQEVLIHRPFGDGHPYEQGPDERYPRQPLAGEPVILGAVTTSDVSEVRAGWWIDDGEQQLVTAPDYQEDERGQRLWRVTLPPFARAQHVHYRLYARRGNEVARSGPFSFTVAGWSDVTSVASDRFESNLVHLTLTLAHVTEGASLTLAFDDPGLVHFHWQLPASASASASPARGESHYRVMQQDGERLQLQTDRLQITIRRRPFHLSVRQLDGAVLLEQSQPPAHLLGQDNHALQLRQTFVATADEAFYGFGERFNALDQRGQQLDVRVYEQYKNQGTRTYIPAPFFISSQGYGLYLNTSRHVVYDLARDGDQWSFHAELDDVGALSYTLIVRAEPWQIVSAFTELTARPALPPPWTFGLWMSANDWNSQAMVEEQVALTNQHQIPVTVLVIEAWSDEATFYIWNDARYKPRPGGEAFTYEDFTFPPHGRWPDPQGLVDALHDQGIRLILWQIPVLKHLEEAHAQQDNDEAYMLAHGYHVRQADGNPYRVRPFWFHDGLLWDVTNPAGVDWWLRKRAYLLEMGVDGFKTDGGEHIWGRDLRFGDGRGSDELWNLYPNLYAGAYHRFANEKRRGGAVTFSRAGFTGAQAFPAHWAGDENSTWDAFRASILAGLNAGISGIPFWGWDIAGFSGELPSAELYLRATAMAAFCPIMQYHSEYNARRKPSRDRTPWNIQQRTGDEDVIPVFRRFANLRMNLLPYILSEARRASDSGVPLMRALPLEFPADRQLANYPFQYLFGPALLVVPVVEPGRDTWPVYLPAGRWYDFWSGAQFEGPQLVQVEAPEQRIPVFVRAGSIVPLNLDASYAMPGAVGNDVDRYRQLTFRLYPAADAVYDWHDHVSGESYAFRMQQTDKADLRVEITALPYDITLNVAAYRASQVIVDGKGVPAAESFEGWRATAEESWHGEAGRGGVWLRLNASSRTRQVEIAVTPSA